MIGKYFQHYIRARMIHHRKINVNNLRHVGLLSCIKLARQRITEILFKAAYSNSKPHSHTVCYCQLEYQSVAICSFYRGVIYLFALSRSLFVWNVIVLRSYLFDRDESDQLQFGGGIGSHGSTELFVTGNGIGTRYKISEKQTQRQCHNGR